jgi:hypothetical protein
MFDLTDEHEQFPSRQVGMSSSKLHLIISFVESRWYEQAERQHRLHMAHGQLSNAWPRRDETCHRQNSQYYTARLILIEFMPSNVSSFSLQGFQNKVRRLPFSHVVHMLEHRGITKPWLVLVAFTSEIWHMTPRSAYLELRVRVPSDVLCLLETLCVVVDPVLWSSCCCPFSRYPHRRRW